MRKFMTGKFSKILALLLAVCLIGSAFVLTASAEDATSTLRLNRDGVKAGTTDTNFYSTYNVGSEIKFYNTSAQDNSETVDSEVSMSFSTGSAKYLFAELGEDNATGNRYVTFEHRNTTATGTNGYVRLSPYGAAWSTTVYNGYTLKGQTMVLDFDMTAFDVNGDTIADAPSLQIAGAMSYDGSGNGKKQPGLNWNLKEYFSANPEEWVHVTIIVKLAETATSTATSTIYFYLYINGEFKAEKQISKYTNYNGRAITYFNLNMADAADISESDSPRYKFALDNYTTHFYSDSYRSVAEGDLTFASLLENPTAPAAPLYMYEDLVYYYENYNKVNGNPDIINVDGTGYKYESFWDDAIASIKEGSVVTATKAIENFIPAPGVNNVTFNAPLVTLSEAAKSTHVITGVNGEFTLSPKVASKHPVTFTYNGTVIGIGELEADVAIASPDVFVTDSLNSGFKKFTSWVYDDPTTESTELVDITALTASQLDAVWAKTDGVSLVLSPKADSYTALEASYVKYIANGGIFVADEFGVALPTELNGNYEVYTDVDSVLTLTAGANVALNMNGNKLSAGFAGQASVTINNAVVTAASLTDGTTSVTVGTGNKFYGTDLASFTVDNENLVYVNADVIDENGTLTAICKTLADRDVVTVIWNDGNGDEYVKQLWYTGSEVSHPDTSDRERFPVLGEKGPYYGWCDVINAYSESATATVTADTTFNLDPGIYVILGANVKGIWYNVNIDSSFDIVVYSPIHYMKDENGEFVKVNPEVEGVVFTGMGGNKSDDFDGEYVQIGENLYAKAIYRQVSMRKTHDPFLPEFYFTVNGVEMTYTMEITITSYAEAVWKTNPCGSEAATLVTAMMNYAESFRYYKDNKNATTAAVREGGAHYNCACQTALAAYADNPYAEEMTKLTEGEDYKCGDHIYGFTMHVLINEPAIALVFEKGKIGNITETAGEGKVNAIRYTYVDYRGKTVTETHLFKGATTGGWTEFYNNGDTVFAKPANIYVVDLLAPVTIELLTCTKLNKSNHMKSTFEILDTVQYSVAEYYEYLGSKKAATELSATEIERNKNSLAKLYALSQASIAYRTN